MAEASVHKKGMIGLKIVEMTIAIACTILHYYSYAEGDVIAAFLCTGSFVGYIIILGAVIASFVMRAPVHQRLDLFFSIVGCGMYLASGILIIRVWNLAFRTKTRDLAILKGATAIINGALFFFDFTFTFIINRKIVFK